MSINFGGGSQKQGQTVTPQIAGPSPAEQKLQELNLQMAQLQAKQMQDAMDQQNQYATSPQGQQSQQLSDLAQKNLIARLSGQAPVLDPAQQAMLDQAYNATNRQGMEDLSRFSSEQAAQRGLTTADSPIGAEALRQARLFQSDLASKKAASALDLGQTGANFNQSIAQFQAGLQQQAMNNRLALSSAQPASYGMQGNLFAQRLAAAPRSMSGYGNQSQTGYGMNFGQIGQGIGGIGQGLSAYGRMFPSGGGLSGGGGFSGFSPSALDAQSYGYM